MLQLVSVRAEMDGEKSEIILLSQKLIASIASFLDTKSEGIFLSSDLFACKI
jgi:hypothetical protein